MGRKRGVQYRPGSFFRTDERSGFAVRAEDTRQEWTGSIVADRLWEARQPQDFVKGVPDDQSVPNPRPENAPQWDGPVSVQLSAAVAIGATFLPLQGIAGFSDGDRVGLMLDSGLVFNTTVAGNPVAAGVNIATPTPYTAASGNLLTDYGAVGP